ncbi:MOSC domain-containing protein [Dethiosulfatarculus sandiegensis]|uniref:MOSC domain-containing protein n=1 Tax=Dethiosulfatarculus sandiegensis TaxID=1429043 RepID=UPI0005CA3531
MKAKIVSVNISTQKGVRKQPVPQVELKPAHGVIGDAHAGEWHRQVSLLAEESIDSMRKKGLDVKPGDFAENITTSGLRLHTMSVGTRLFLGDVEVELTQIGKECHKGCAIREQAGDCVMPREGVFVKVLQPGIVRPGDEIRLA